MAEDRHAVAEPAAAEDAAEDRPDVVAGVIAERRMERARALIRRGVPRESACWIALSASDGSTPICRAIAWMRASSRCPMTSFVRSLMTLSSMTAPGPRSIAPAASARRQ
jgi:hypothetical protein